MSNLDSKILGILDMGVQITMERTRVKGYSVNLTQRSPNGGCDYTGAASHEILSTALAAAYGKLRYDRYGDELEEEKS